ncbi:MAG TPA: hypothetical protein VGM17_15365, partial [Rhizomicrobium sp.]
SDGTTAWQGVFDNKGHPIMTGVTLAWSGTHPIVYSAVGSHGIWASPGAHIYEYAAGDTLVDHTSQGAPWQTWNAIALASDPKYSTLLQHFEGDWGNQKRGNNVCDYVRASFVALPIWTRFIIWGFEYKTDVNICDPMSDVLRTTYQLNDGPSIPDHPRKPWYLNPANVTLCEDSPMVSGLDLLGLGRDGALYRKTLPDGAWTKVAGYASTHKIVSITARQDGTLVGLDAGGSIFQLSRPYSGDWSVLNTPARPEISGISVDTDGTLIGVGAGSLLRLAADGSQWEPFGVRLVNSPWNVARMPNSNYLVGAPANAKSSYVSFMSEYADDNGVMEMVSLTGASRHTLENPYYNGPEAADMLTKQPESFVYLPNGALVWSTETNTPRLMTWTVNSCGRLSQSQISNDGAPGRLSGADPTWPQWKAFAVVTAF